MRRIASSPIFSLGSLFLPQLRHLRRTALMAGDPVWEQVFDGDFENRDYAIDVFNHWNEKVREDVPEEKLLVYEVKEGWEPLCEFLGVAAPENKSFPHLNDAQTFHKMVRQRIVAIFALASILFLALLYLIVRARRLSNRPLPG